MADLDPIVTPDDIRAAGHCATGLRDWLAAHDMTLAAFFAGQYRASDFRNTQDANGIRVADVAVERAS